MSYTANERIVRRNVSYLLDTLTMDDFATTYEGKKSDLKKTYDKLIKYLNSKLTETTSYVKYDYIKGRSDGRLFWQNSIQNCPCEYRTFITEGLVTDVDVQNAHCVILAQLCEEHDFLCPNLNDYNANRTKHLQSISNYDSINLVQAKKKVLVSINDGKKIKTSCPFLRAFDDEVKSLHKKFLEKDCYHYIREYAKNDGNFNGSFLNHLLCINEDKILYSLRECCELNDIKIHSLFFDGLMVYGTINPSTLEMMTSHIRMNTIFTKVVLTIKQHEHSFTIPPDYIPATRTSYEDVKEAFEKENCKVGIQFVCNSHNSIKIYTEAEFNILYKAKTYINGDGKKQKFIGMWLDDEAKRNYDNFDSFPNDAVCPIYTYNLWEKFPVEIIESTYSSKTVKAVKWFLEHIEVLADHNPEHSAFIKMWFAQMFQYPENKTVMMMFVGKEGSGKGTFVKFLETIMGGKQKCWSCCNPMDTLFGFNDMLLKAFLVILNEADKSGCYHKLGVLKDYITEPTITINAKGKPIVTINSYHRWLGFSNNPDPLAINALDRRAIVFSMSDEKVGNEAYFIEGNLYAKDLDCCKAIYDYFMTYPTTPNIGINQIPKSEYTDMLKIANVDSVTEFLDYIGSNYDDKAGFTAIQLYACYMDFCRSQHIHDSAILKKGTLYSMLGYRRKKHPSISFIKKKRVGNYNGSYYIIDTPLLRKELEFDDEELPDVGSDDEVI
jgi:hypothetical protein